MTEPNRRAGAVAERSGELAALDRAHQVHPQHLDTDQGQPVILARGQGAVLWDVDGRRYLDGMSCLWNVNVGHGRRELAEAAAEQIGTLAFANNYIGFSNEPATRLAARLAELAPGDLNHVFFTTGGGESNESAFKLARFYWTLRGRPEKIKIVSRLGGYHGVGMGAMAATGLPAYWTHFGPLPSGFCQVPPMSAEALEAKIVAEGPDTVAAFIAEPVQGVAGVLPPPPDYFPAVRAICDRYDVLLIADEVITGFGRTGRYWGIEHWNVVPDIIAFAKGVTSGYLPLGGIIFSDGIRATMHAAAQDRFMHAYTYSGHATCCAVGLRNLEIIDQEGLVARAAVSGRRVDEALAPLASKPYVVDRRGLGLMAAVEFRAGSGIAGRALAEARRRGLITRSREEHLMLAPPLSSSDAELDEMTDIFKAAVVAAAG
jgi:adenosylmethionine-8-amino-7-oxononanoate aminotransferase